MRIEVKVPQLPESVAEATLVSWHKKPGDAVTRDENLIDVETDKVVLELPAPGDGVLVELVQARRRDGDVERGHRDHRYRSEGRGRRQLPRRRRPSRSQRPRRRGRRCPGRRRHRAARGAQDDGRAGRGSRTVDGTGRGGRVTKGDVLAAVEAKAAPARCRAARAAKAPPPPAVPLPSRSAPVPSSACRCRACARAWPSASCSRSRPPRSSPRSTK